MKNSATSFKLFVLIGFLMFVNYAIGQTSYVVGESVEDSLTEFNWASEGNCYDEFHDISIDFPNSEVSGIDHVLVITNIEFTDDGTIIPYTDNFGEIEVGDEIPFDELNHKLYCPSSVFIQGVFMAKGTPEVEGEIYTCSEIAFYHSLVECSSSIIYHYEDTGEPIPECEVQPTDCVNGSCLTAISCENYTLNDKTYVETGLYEQVLKNAQNCDSIISLDLTILEPYSSNLTASACESYSYNEEVYEESGIYTHIFEAQNGCDSTVVLNLTISEPQTLSVSETACESYSYNGEIYEETGEYTHLFQDENGCDSTVTLNLTISEPQFSTLIETACVSYSYNGEIYEKTGFYTHIFELENGCDSTVSLDLTILEPQNSTLKETACESYTYNGEVYDESGVYVHTFEAQNGCDSTVILELTVNYIEDLNLKTKLSDNILTAQANNVSYRWLDCNENMKPIPEETNKNFEIEQEGSYAVEISNGSCTSQSECLETSFFRIEDHQNFDCNLYPNPTKNSFKFINNTSSTANIVITDAQGKELYRRVSNDIKTQIDINLPPGVYMVSLIDETGVLCMKKLIVS